MSLISMSTPMVPQHRDLNYQNEFSYFSADDKMTLRVIQG
jgi:hypothetical protein